MAGRYDLRAAGGSGETCEDERCSARSVTSRRGERHCGISGENRRNQLRAKSPQLLCLPKYNESIS